MKVRVKANFFDGVLHEKGEEFEYNLPKGAKLPSCLEAISEVDEPKKTRSKPTDVTPVGDMDVI